MTVWFLAILCQPFVELTIPLLYIDIFLIDYNIWVLKLRQRRWTFSSSHHSTKAPKTTSALELVRIFRVFLLILFFFLSSFLFFKLSLSLFFLLSYYLLLFLFLELLKLSFVKLLKLRELTTATTLLYLLPHLSHLEIIRRHLRNLWPWYVMWGLIIFYFISFLILVVGLITGTNLMNVTLFLLVSRGLLILITWFLLLKGDLVGSNFFLRFLLIILFLLPRLSTSWTSAMLTHQSIFFMIMNLWIFIIYFNVRFIYLEWQLLLFILLIRNISLILQLF